MSSQLRDLPLRGILIYVVNTICFSVISLLVKELSIQFSISELLLVRFFCTFLGMALLIQFKGGFPLLRTRKALDLAIRTASGMIAIALSFVAFSGALLADATALVFSAPLFTLLLSIPVLSERINRQKIFAVLTGFLGVVLITRPGFNNVSPALYAALGSAIFFSIVTVWLRRLNQTVHPLAISFYYNLTGTLVFFLWSWSSGWSEAWSEIHGMLLLLGLIGIIQQVMLSYSFRFAEASLLAPFDYLSLPLALVFGYWFWNEFPDWLSLVGSTIILISGMMLMLRHWNLDLKKKIGEESTSSHE
ncbi:MAG: DMT family transporter [SAR324 cluster bacterium]|nr:DMT family transporter [SAR324 cluster bacterium]MDP6465249.1 DMT family transporter [SAR324 cluster bacterium]